MNSSTMPHRALALWLMFAVGVLTACREASQQLRLVGGADLGALVGVRDPGVVLIADPATCFSCDPYVSRWVEQAQSAKAGVFLVFTREPTPAELTRFRLQRTRWDGILDPARRWQRSRPGESKMALLVDGRTVLVKPLRPTLADTLIYRYIDPR